MLKGEALNARTANRKASVLDGAAERVRALLLEPVPGGALGAVRLRRRDDLGGAARGSEKPRM